MSVGIADDDNATLRTLQALSLHVVVADNLIVALALHVGNAYRCSDACFASVEDGAIGLVEVGSVSE